MEKRVISLVFFLILISSCKKKQNHNNPFNLSVPKISNSNTFTYDKSVLKHLNINPERAEFLEFNEWFKLEKLMYLDNTKLLGDIDKILFIEEKVLILDRSNTKKVVCFNENGDLLWEYAHLGNGPKEYKEITDMTLDYESKELLLLDEKAFKILRIATDNGEYKGTEKISTYTSNIEFQRGRKLIYASRTSYDSSLNFKLLTFNKENEVVSRNLPYKSDIDINKSYVPMQPLSSNKKGEIIYFTETYNDTVYKIEKNSIKALYKVNYGDYSLDYNDISSLKELERKKAKKFFIDIPMSGVIDYKGYIIFNYPFPYQSTNYLGYNTCILNKKNNEVEKIYSMVKDYPLTDAKDGQLLFKTSNDKYLIQIIYPYFFDQLRKKINHKNKTEKGKKEVEDFFFNEKRKDLYSLIMNTNEYSNPVLAFYSMKK